METRKSSSISATAIKKSSKLIRFLDGIERYSYSNGEEYTAYPDGMLKAVNKNGIKIVEFPDKTKEILFPDGRIIKLDSQNQVVDISFGSGTLK